MTIVIDSHIPFFVEAVRREWPQIDIYPIKPDEIDAESVRKADVLVIRTRTRVNEDLLHRSKVQLVCTATIGYDHIDTAYCESHGIQWISCPGCNAQAVCDYIEEAINESPVIKAPSPATIGVVGVGHVGALVADMAARKGMQVLLNDPPKKIGVSLDEIARKCDIITFHVPLVHPSPTAIHTTWHLCDEHFLERCKPGAMIINAARGGVVDEQALMRSGHPFILDTWENEPKIDEAVLTKAWRASMHIAGYSVEGKRNASQMCLDAIAERFDLPKITPDPTSVNLSTAGDSAPGWLSRISTLLKAQPDQFESLRKNYHLR